MMIQNKPAVLIVDDEESIRRFLRLALKSRGYQVFEAATGEEGLSIAASSKPDLIILDLGLPDHDGIEVTALLRQWSRAQIVILSVRDSEKDKVAALDAGADDYLTKPFTIGELLARLRVAQRHAAQPKGEDVIKAGELKVDIINRVVTMSDREIQLTPMEYDLLKFLMLNAGKVLTHRQLLKEVWGSAYMSEFHILHVNISNLRHKIEPDPARPHYIFTEPGVGYRLKLT